MLRSSKTIVDVQPLAGYQLHLRFDDGVEGIVDISQIIEFTGIFTPLKNPDYFAKVQVNTGGDLSNLTHGSPVISILSCIIRLHWFGQFAQSGRNVKPERLILH
ncbi:MAG: DUF2442 domain-containing protein [Coleofasciculus sp. A1-SPW-01]|uniref:DUF2442 domain-containing protein n=1 Tax=Coleofasciculus sp. A1-SPW-01 TaxID=3070819 RepID=UPI0032FB93F8